MKREKVANTLGLANKAGKTVIGKHKISKAIQSFNCWLVLLASDAGNDIKQEIERMCRQYRVPYITIGTKTALGQWIGKNCVSALAITDEGLAKKIMKNDQQNNSNNFSN